MNSRTIDIIERAVTVRNVLDAHGVRCHGSRCHCPIHHGNRDSFSFTNTLFHCFTCGESGGVIQLEAALSGVDDDTACQLIADRHRLDISDTEWSAEDRKNYAIQKRVDASYSDYLSDQKEYYKRMTNLFRNIRTVPELYDMAKDLRDWLDENINGVKQPWRYLNMN